MKNILRKQYFEEILLILLGSIISGVAVNGIYIKHSILTGGISGIAIFMNLLARWDVSIMVVVLNVPLLFLGYKFVNRRFTILSILGISFYTITLSITKNIPSITENLISAILLGGVLTGLGNGILFKGGGSGGGLNIVGKVLNRFWGLNFATISFVFNIFIVTISALRFGIDIAIYTLATIYISTKVTNFVLDGINHKRTVFIVSNNTTIIAEKIIKQVHRGVTELVGKGVYTGETKDVIFCTVSIHQVNQIKKIVKEIDPKAFMTVSEAYEVFGKGFLDINEI